MHIVHVHVRVRPEDLGAFTAAVLDNARNSVREPGVVRFDVLRQADDPTRFVLVEIYRTPQDVESHRTTPHYLRWRDAVAPMMAEPRTPVRYEAVHLPAGGVA